MRLTRASLFERPTCHHGSGVATKCCRPAASGRQGQKLRCREKILNVRGPMISDRFVGEESEESVVQNRAADRTAKVVEPGIVSYRVEHSGNATSGKGI